MNIIIASNRLFPNSQVSNPKELNKLLNLVKPKVIFFPYWSWKVPENIVNNYICIGFHTGFINGGSPIQNLIRRGIGNTYIRVFKLNNEIDGGEVIFKIPISLQGSLEEIIIRQTDLINDYIQTHYR